MFDWIVGVPELKCECGAPLSGWQSKDADCLSKQIHFSWVGRFYTSCYSCGRWHEYSRCGLFEDQDWTIPKPDVDFDSFTKVVCGEA